MIMKNILFCFLLLLPLSSGAQQLLNINDAIDIALTNNFEIQIARNNTEITRINNSYGVAGGLPSLNITATNNNSKYDLNQKLSTGVEINKNDVTSHSINSGLTASMVLFNGFRIIATKEKLNILQSQSELDLNQQVQNTIAAVMISYYDILRQQNYLDIIKSSIDVSLKKSEIVSERYNVGMANDADLLQARMDLDLAEQNLKSQQLIIEQGKINLLQVMGVNEFYPVIIQDSILVDKTIKKDSIISTLENNPQFLSAEQQIRINEQIVKELRAQRYPSIRISTGYNYSYNSSSGGFNLFNQNYGPTVGAPLQIPIFNGTIYKTQQNVATIGVKNAELQKEGLLISLKADAVKTYQSYESTMEQINSQQRVYENAAKLVELIVHRFQLNQATILEVKAAQSSFENAGYMLVNLQFAAKMAEIELKRLVFQLGN
jgi:outer membrane protein TolC